MQNKKVMIIEDDADSLVLYEELLQAEGYEVSTMEHGQEALEHLSTGEVPDLIVMDLQFPRMTPDEFVQEMGRTPGAKGIPLVIVSGKEDIQEWSRKLGACGFIRKPFDFDPFLELIRKNI